MTKTANFDPNAAAQADSGIFGLPLDGEAEAALVYLPIPWEVTTSYGGGTSGGPEAIFEASKQVDLYDLEVERPYEAGLFMTEAPAGVAEWNADGKRRAQRIIEVGGAIEGNADLKAELARVNELGEKLNGAVRESVTKIYRSGRIPGVVGGDHAVPFGAFQAAAAQHPGGFGVLHFDAHSDTRMAYEGFQWSHASIMHNALSRIPQIKKLVQVGIRDFCEEEVDYCRSQGERVKIFFDAHLARQKFEGAAWSEICASIISQLPNDVWISFDIDGLDPRFCPHTGTPVPGGLDLHEVYFILRELVKLGKRILGFDLNEVAPGPEGDEWDANVGARLLYKLAAWTLVSHGRARPR